jgi:hypothetical protein
LLLEYGASSLLRCYYRQVHRDGSVTGTFRRGSCPFVDTASTRYLAFDSGLDEEGDARMEHDVDFAQADHVVPVAVDDPGRVPLPGDIYEGLCADLSEPDPRNPARRGCAFSPQGHTFYRMRPALTIDPAGRVWRLGPGRALTVTEPTTSWEAGPVADGLRLQTAPLPFRPRELLGSDGKAAVTWPESTLGTYVTDDLGASWQRIRSLPDTVAGGNIETTAFLPDGRLILGPADGALWRATDTTNLHYEAIDAGPIETIISAGDLLYGMGDRYDPGSDVWVSTDAGSTWRQVLGRNGATPGRRPMPADRLKVLGQPEVASVVARRPPSDVAVTSAGLVLVVYGDAGDRSQTAWRLYGRHDEVLAGGLDAASVAVAGDGFLLSTDTGERFVGADGSVTRIDTRYGLRLPVRAGDVVVDDDPGTFRPQGRKLFIGVAEPDGTVTAVDGLGRMWARGRDHNGRTVVRWATPGRAWHSREIGPALGTGTVVGRGSTLLITGYRRMLLSADAGETWRLLVHGATAYVGPPSFSIRPDGSIIGGDPAAGWRVSSDLRTFQDAAYLDILDDKYVGDLFARGTGAHLEVSRDRVNWLPFSPAAARSLLR